MSRLKTLLMISSMNGGGSERQTIHLLRHLDRERFEPHLYLSRRAGDLIDAIPRDVQVHAFEDAAPGGDGGVYFPGKELRRQSDHVRGVLAEASIDVIYDRTFHMSLIASSPGLRLAIPRVSTIVSPPEFALPHVEKRFVAMKRRRISRALRRSAAVIAVSRQTADSAARYYRLPSESIQVITNPVDWQRIESVTAEVKSSSGAASVDGGTRLVCIARMTAEKGHDDLIAAVQEIRRDHPEHYRGLTLDLVGDGPLRTSLQQRVDEAGIQDTVRFLGQQSDPFPALAAASGLVLASTFEGMPNVILEAMAAGVPVIATRTGGVAELQYDSPTMFLGEPGDASSIARGICDFIQDPARAERHVESATEMIRSRHDVAKTTRLVESVLSEAVSHKGERDYTR